MSLGDIVRCRKCENRAITAGLCAGCASKELTRLWKLEAVLRNTPGNMPPPVVDYLRFLSSFVSVWGAKYLLDLADALEDSHG